MIRLLFIFIFIFVSPSLLAATKKDSLNQTTALMDKETMYNAGTWKLYMEKCDGSTFKKFMQKLPKLSWPDFKNFNSGALRYAQNYVAGACDNKETIKGANFYNWVIEELEYLVNYNESSNSTQADTFDEINELDNVEEKLKKLQSLFDKGLISEDEYAEKRKEILDNF